MSETKKSLGDLLAEKLLQAQYRPKCDQWCKRCGRKHNKRDVCNVFLRTRTAKSGKEIKVWAA